MGNLSALPPGLDTSPLNALGSVSQPPLMGNVDPSKIDEIRRTVYVGNLNSQVNGPGSSFSKITIYSNLEIPLSANQLNNTILHQLR